MTVNTALALTTIMTKAMFMRVPSSMALSKDTANIFLRTVITMRALSTEEKGQDRVASFTQMAPFSTANFNLTRFPDKLKSVTGTVIHLNPVSSDR
jgi:hypothetical protein